MNADPEVMDRAQLEDALSSLGFDISKLTGTEPDDFLREVLRMAAEAGCDCNKQEPEQQPDQEQPKSDVVQLAEFYKAHAERFAEMNVGLPGMLRAFSSAKRKRGGKLSFADFAETVMPMQNEMANDAATAVTTFNPQSDYPQSRPDDPSKAFFSERRTPPRPRKFSQLMPYGSRRE